MRITHSQSRPGYYRVLFCLGLLKNLDKSDRTTVLQGCYIMCVEIGLAAVAREPALERQRNRRAAHVDEHRHDDVPAGEPLPRMAQLVHDAAGQSPDVVGGVEERPEDGQEHHVQAAQEIQRKESFVVVHSSTFL